MQQERSGGEDLAGAANAVVATRFPIKPLTRRSGVQYRQGARAGSPVNRRMATGSAPPSATGGHSSASRAKTLSASSTRAWWSGS